MQQTTTSRQRGLTSAAIAVRDLSGPIRLAFLLAAMVVLGQVFGSRALALDSENIRIAKALSNAYAEVVDHVAPAVVGIETEKIVKPSMSMRGGDDPTLEFFERFFDLPPGLRNRNTPRRPLPEEKQKKSTGIGSGIIIDAQGHILTNNHVVDEADNIKVELANEKGRTYKAEVVGRDPNSDLAVIKLTNPPAELPFAELGDSEAMKPGNIVIAIGSPLGFKQSVTTGVVSAKGRNLGELAYERFVQTDASINPGNSGGPLVNLDGEVVGINTMISTQGGGSIGIGFSIPINQAKAVVAQLIEKGSVTRGWLGIVMNSPESREMSLYLGHDGTGVVVAEVDPAGPAAKGGLRQRDVITKFDGVDIRDNEHLRYRVAETTPDESVPVEIIRDGEKMTLYITIEAQPDDLYKASRRRGGNGGGGGSLEADEVNSSLGMTVRNLDKEARERYSIPDDVQGVVVTEVDSTGEAMEKGIQAGTVITEMNKKPVKNVADFRSILKETSSGEQILVYARRGQISSYIILELK